MTLWQRRFSLWSPASSYCPILSVGLIEPMLGSWYNIWDLADEALLPTGKCLWRRTFQLCFLLSF
jgi:hypothetical protein